MRERLLYIDIAKAIALIFVICGHTNWGGEFGIFAFCVPAFYILSGYTYHKKTFSRDVKNKVQRLLLPYVIFNLILLFIYWCVHSSISSNQLLGVFYSRFSLYKLGSDQNVYFLSADNAPTWFLTSLFCSYILFWGIITSKRHAFITIIISFYLFIAILLNQTDLLLPWSIDTAFCTAVFIYGGYYLNKVVYIHSNVKKSIILIVCAIIYIATYLCNGNMNISIRNYGLSVILCITTGFSGTFCLVELSKKIERLPQMIVRPLASIGRNSLVIFAMQLPLINYGGKLVASFINGQGFIQGLCVCVSQMLFALLIGYLLAKIAHRILPLSF